MALPIHFPSGPPDARNPLMPQALRSISIDLTCQRPYGELAKLYRAIEAALPHVNNRVVQFTSAYSGEGASEIAFETAVIAARLIGKRVLFIDTAGIQTRMTRKLPDSIGVPLDTLLMTGRPPHEGIAQASGVELYFAMLRERDEDGFSSVSIKAIEAALINLRSSFDLIVVDSQDILTDAFGMALAKLVDGSVLVLEAEATRAPVALECKRLIETGGGRVIGSVLNRRRFYIPQWVYRLLFRHETV